MGRWMKKFTGISFLSSGRRTGSSESNRFQQRLMFF